MFSEEGPKTIVRWPMVRIQDGHSVQVQLLSSEWVRLCTHFFRTTFICSETEACASCVLLPSRPYWYLPVLVPAVKRPGLLELSAHSSADLEQKVRFTGHALTAGALIELSRKGKRKPLRIEVLDFVSNPPTATLHEWLTPLMAVFGMPAVCCGESLTDYGIRISRLVEERSVLRAEQMRGAKNGRLLGR